MSSLYIAVDIDDRETISMLSYAQTIAKQKVKGDYVDAQSFHITLEFLSDNEQDNEKVKQAMNELKSYDIKPFYVFCSHVNRFDMGAAWGDVANSFSLYKIKHLFDKLLVNNNYEKQDSFDEYVPHITFAYNTPEFKPFSIPKTPILINNLSLWNSPKIKDVYVTNCLHRIDF